MIVYYEKPLLTFERLLETYLAVAPRRLCSFIATMQLWLRGKLFLKSELNHKFKSLKKELFPNTKIHLPKFLFSENHLSHAAAAFYPSSFDESVIFCMNGVGEWATTSTLVSKKNRINPLWDFIKVHKKYWLAPLIITIVLMGAFNEFTQVSVVAPFIYSIF